MDKSSVGCFGKVVGWTFVVLLLYLPYHLGAESQSIWVGILVLAGILLAWTGTIIYLAQESLGTYLILALPSLVCLAVATWLSRLAGEWWWAGVWLIVALAHYLTAIEVWQENDAHMRVALVLGIVATAAAILCPWLLYPILQNTEPLSISASLWMWVLLALGLSALAIAWYQGYIEIEGTPFAFWALVGVGLLAGATWLSGLRGGWELAVAGLLAAVVLGHAARKLFRYYEPGGGWLGSILAMVCVSASVWSVLQTAQIPSQPIAQVTPVVSTPSATARAATPMPTPTPVTPPTATLNLDEFQKLASTALQNFLTTTFFSIWGIFHWLTLIALGYLWLGRGWRSMLPLAALLVIVWLLGGTQSGMVNSLTRFFSSSPADWMRDMLLFSIERWGTMGWGILLTAVLVSVVTLPTVRFSSKFNRVWRLRTGSELTQSTMQKIAVALRIMNVQPLDGLVATGVALVVPGGLGVALWMALRESATFSSVPLGFLDIPDLTVPHLWPVWSLHYYSLGLALWLAMLAFRRLQKKYDPVLPVYESFSNTVVLFIGALVTASLVPAGVILFSIALTASQILLFPARVIGIPTLRIPEPPPPPPPPPPQQQQLPPPPPPPQPQQRVVPVWNSPSPLAVMLHWQEACWFLQEDGDLVVHTNAPATKITLPVSKGQALFALKEVAEGTESQVLVIGNGKDVLWVSRKSQNVVKTVTLSKYTHGWTLNPFKTLLAWVDTSDGTVGGLYLESGREMTFLTDTPLEPALAFSNDGRYLALGGPNGAIHLLDVATRKVTTTLTLPEDSSSVKKAVRVLFRCQDDGWVCVYQDRRIVRWTADGQVDKKMGPIRRKINALDYHPPTERLALGLSDGILQVFDADLNKIFEDTVQEKEITWVSFSQDGRWVFTIGGKTEVRKVSL